MLVEQWMSKKTVTARRSDSVGEAQRALTRHAIRQLPVVERGRLIGIVTDRDLRSAPPEARKVQDVMSFEPRTVDAAESIDSAAHLMRTWKVNALPVVRKGKLAGVITTSDLLDAFIALSGAAEPSYRLVIVPAARSRLRSIGHVIEGTHSEVRWLRETGKGRSRQAHARVVTNDVDSVVTALEAAGHAVIATVTSKAPGA